MKEHVDAYIENLEQKVQPVIDKIVCELRNLYKKYPLKNDSDHRKWETFLRLCKENPEEIKFYISRLPYYEKQPTLKTGINTKEENNQKGFILPLTIGHATELLTQITPEDYRLLCKYAAMNYILFLQDLIESVKAKYNGGEMSAVDEAFIFNKRQDMQPLIETTNALEDEKNNKDWRQIIQLYYEQ